MAQLPLVGDEYIEIKRGETILEGDEYWGDEWIKYPIIFCPSVNSTMTLMRRKVNTMETKFKVGDRVRQIESGYGTSPNDQGKVAIVTEIGNDIWYYKDHNMLGMRINRLGNKWFCTQDVVGVNAFELVEVKKMKEMQINNCTLEQRKAIHSLALTINPKWNEHMDSCGNYFMPYSHLFFDGEDFVGTNENFDRAVVTFQEFISEMLQFVPVVEKLIVIKLNDSYSVTIDKQNKVINVSGYDAISFDAIDNLYRVATSKYDSIKLNNDLTATIDCSVNIVVGCQTFPGEALARLHKAIQ